MEKKPVRLDSAPDPLSGKGYVLVRAPGEVGVFYVREDALRELGLTKRHIVKPKKPEGDNAGQS